MNTEINRSVLDEKIEIVSAAYSNYKGMIALVGKDNKVYLGKKEKYHSNIDKDDESAFYDNSDNSLLWISDNQNMFSFLYSTGWVKTQKQMLKYGFTMKDYYEFDNLQNELLYKFDKTCEMKFKDTPFKSPEELLEEINLDKYVGKKINAYEDIYQFSTGKKIYTRSKCVGLILGYDDEKVYFYHHKNPGEYKFYSIDTKDCKKWLFEGSYKINYNSLNSVELYELEKYKQEKELNNKIEVLEI